MIRIWAKVLLDNKIIKQCVDIPTPVIIKTHLFNYAKYNTVKFTKQDFVESIDFDKLVFENAFL